MIERYFIVFYEAHQSNNIIRGHTTFTTNGCYLVLKTVKESISERISEGCNTIITNIIELNESDYKDWNS